MLRCQVCQSPHPSGYPKVGLELDHFLEEQFPEEYAQRRDAVKLRQIKVKPESPSSCALVRGSEGENIALWFDLHSKVHIAVGCDFCGMYPITGDRYRCKDCKEKIGFDLCSDCHSSRSKLRGRFNQQHTSEYKLPGRFNQLHTSEHKLVLEETSIIRNIMMKLITGQLEDGLTESSENPLLVNVQDNHHGSGATDENF